jgi:hypothetical protein
MMERKKMGLYKKDFEVVLSNSSQNIDFPFLFEETLGVFLFLSCPFSFFFSLFSSILFLSFSMLHLFKDSRILMMFDVKDSLQKFFSNGMR